MLVGLGGTPTHQVEVMGSERKCLRSLDTHTALRPMCILPYRLGKFSVNSFIRKTALSVCFFIFRTCCFLAIQVSLLINFFHSTR